MELIWTYLKAFLVGGSLCLIGQVLIDKTKLTPARILTAYVVTGVILSGMGIYEPFAKWAGAGATVPLLGFGNSLAKGVKKAVAEQGFLGILSGGLTACAGGITAAVFFGLLVALLCKPKDKTK
ncbi:MAG: stage V sporulation protein AE [Oscillospiraceae bacterium]|nr:stage V sporulation protein AE [Oscillospiraceae bacterium]